MTSQVDAFHSTGSLKERATIDVVIIIFAVVVGSIMVLAIIGVIIFELITKGLSETGPILNLVDAQVSVIVGALVGLIAGQASARQQVRAVANVKSNTPDA